jgi:HWE histidine kinase
VIARQTATGDAQDFIGRFSERIRARAAYQDLLVRHEWQRIDVKDLVPLHYAPSGLQWRLTRAADAVEREG